MSNEENEKISEAELEEACRGHAAMLRLPITKPIDCIDRTAKREEKSKDGDNSEK